MTAPNTQDNKSKAAREAEELQDRIINLQDQEREVQREAAERRDRESLEALQRDRSEVDTRRSQQVQAYRMLGRQARDGARQVEVGTRTMARGTAVSVATLLPPVMTQPSLLVDVVFNSAIAVLSFQRDVLTDLLSLGQTVDAR